MVGVPLVLRLRECLDVARVGGKAVNLARLMEAGFPVPDGFVITTEAYRLADSPRKVSTELAERIADAYRRLGSPRVAVRSSATAEDMAGASMAGQYETFLDLLGEAQVLAAVEKCWASVQSDRALTYLAEHSIDPKDVAMAVVVQTLVPADAAGVLFTANPRTGSREEMLLEASWGLGEAVVSGMVQPDALVLNRADGTVKSAAIADKLVWIVPGAGEAMPAPVPENLRSAASLNSRQVHSLWQLGLRAAEYFGSPQDMEWAIQGANVYLLQSRPITTIDDAEADQQCLEEARRRIVAWESEGRGGWVRHNLAETLPHPTPLTWSVMKRFMSGVGGFGAMYRMVGFEPSPIASNEGVLELIAGQIYMDLSRGPGMFFDGFPYAYDLDLLKADPGAGQGPPSVPKGSFLDQHRAGKRLAKIARRIDFMARGFDRTLQDEVFPAVTEYVGKERARDLTKLAASEWRELWLDREAKILDGFASRLLMPGMIAAMALEQLRGFLEEHFWDDDPVELANMLAIGEEPDLTAQANESLYDVAQGVQNLQDWLQANGHRGVEEFDLASPRWREEPDAARAMAARLRAGANPRIARQKSAEESKRRLGEVRRRLPWGQRRRFDQHVQLASRYMRVREDAKYYLMMGYDLLRDLAMEVARRLDVGEDVFLLSFEELCDALATGYAPLHLLAYRRRMRMAEARLALSNVITIADVSALGQPPELPQGNRLTAFPLAVGVASGPARVVASLRNAGDLGRGYVLVCPSTDPSWTPLFVNAAALVIECGGALSHGAVVAREMGLPAVVCPGATKMIADGETLTVDGRHGAILRGDSPTDAAGEPAEAVNDPNNPCIAARLRPPIPGTCERRCVILRRASFAVWGIFLCAAMFWPGTRFREVSMQAMDAVLWPIVAAWGKPVAVAAIAGGLAVVSMLGQWLLTDNRRLRVAKRRANVLRKLASELPDNSPRRKVMQRLAAPVSSRLAAAAMTPLCLILGPLVLSFLWWLPARVDPASCNAGPGATAFVVATVDGEYLGPVVLEATQDLQLDEATPARQTLPPIRPTLDARLAQWRRQSDLSKLPWELQEAGEWMRQELIADLSDYLKRPLPPQSLSWTLHAPANHQGRFAVKLSAGNVKPIETRLVIGDHFPPEFRDDLGDGKPVQIVRAVEADSPIRAIKVTYSEAIRPGRNVFWAPLTRLGRPNWDAGWLGVYLLSYLPVMLALRWILRIP